MTFIATKLFHKAGEGSGGGGGGDQHNLGWYATQSALEEAHPTATAGDWAIVGSTDTVWLWDTDNEEWVDSDQKGQVTSVNGQTGAVVIPNELPDQTGQSGKFLTTDGTAASWSDSIKVDLKLQGKQYGSKALGFPISTNASRFVQMYCQTDDTLAIYTGAGFYTATGPATLKVHYVTPSNVSSIATLGKANAKWGNVYTEKINNGNDITVPTVAGSMAVQVSSMTTADSTLEGQIYQFVGATDATYTNGRFYKCVSDGQATPTYSWEEVSMGGSSLPSQTGNAGKFLTTDGTDASWSDKPLVNTATGTNAITIGGNSGTGERSVNIGNSSTAGNNCVSIGYNATAQPANSYSMGTAIAIGRVARCTNDARIALGAESVASSPGAIAIGVSTTASAQYAIQLGSGDAWHKPTNSDANTFKVGNNNGNFEIMSADGTIPTARLTKVNTTITLAAADWSSNTQTVSVTGMTATGVVLVSPDPTDQSAYTSAGILCTAQAAGTLTFTCDTVPSGDIDVNVVML